MKTVLILWLIAAAVVIPFAFKAKAAMTDIQAAHAARLSY